MRKFILTLSFFVFTVACYAQKTDTVPFKKCYKIILQNRLSFEDNFKNVGQGLVDSELGIGHKDKEFGQIISAPFKTKDIYYIGKGNSIITFIIKEGQITMSAQYNPNTTTRVISAIENNSSFSPVYYTKAVSRDKIIFERMEKFAKSIPFDKIIYSE